MVTQFSHPEAQQFSHGQHSDEIRTYAKTTRTLHASETIGLEYDQKKIVKTEFQQYNIFVSCYFLPPQKTVEPIHPVRVPGGFCVNGDRQNGARRGEELRGTVEEQ